MIAGELDLGKVENVCWRALCRHHVSEREMVVAATIIRLSFGVGEPYLRLDRAVELALLTGLSKGNAHGVVERLELGRALEVSPDRRLYTFLPPSKAWPWLFKSRVDPHAADEIESGIVSSNSGGAPQGEFWGPGPEREFQEALALERMRASLIEFHRAACAQHFPVKDRPPKPDALQGAGELTRPLETGPGSLHSSPDIVHAADPPAAYYFHPPTLERVTAGGKESSRIGNPEPEKVPESGTSHLVQLSALNVLVSSECTQDSENTKPLSALSGKFPNREPETSAPWARHLSPAADENEVIRWLRDVLGHSVMEKWGGFWRNAIRECRPAVLEAIANYKLRVQSRGMPDCPGGWLRDQYGRFLRVLKS